MRGLNGVGQGDKEMIAVPLSVLQLLQQQAAASEGAGSGPCCCKQFVEISAPAEAESFRFAGSVFQLTDQLSVSYIFSVPGGMEGVINRIGIYEIMPGMQAGNRVSLLVNGEFNSQFPRIASNIGNGAEMAINVNIYLKQNDVVSIMMDCPFQPFAIEDSTGLLQYAVSFVVSGYYINSGYLAPLSKISSEGVC